MRELNVSEMNKERERSVNEWNEEEKKEHNGKNKVSGSVVPFFSLRFTHTNHSLHFPSFFFVPFAFN